jgi:hypothetical protein
MTPVRRLLSRIKSLLGIPTIRGMKADDSPLFFERASKEARVALRGGSGALFEVLW